MQHEKFQSAPGSRVGTPAYLAPEVILTTKGKTYDGKVIHSACTFPPTPPRAASVVHSSRVSPQGQSSDLARLQYQNAVTVSLDAIACMVTGPCSDVAHKPSELRLC